MAVGGRRLVPESVERPYGWVVVLVSMTMMAVALGAPYLVVVALKPIAAEFDWPRAAPSLCYALVLLGGGVGGLIMGHWADRVGVLPPALLGALGTGLGAWWASTADGMLGLYLSHGLLIGLLGNGAFIAPLLANATRWFDRRRGIAIALVASGQNLAGAIWPPVLRSLTDGYGWRRAFLIYGLIALATLVPLSLLIRRPPPAAGLAIDERRRRPGGSAPSTGRRAWSRPCCAWPSSAAASRWRCRWCT